MVFCANIVLAIFNRIQRSFLVEQHLKCSSEVGDFVMSQLISFPEMGKKKKKSKKGPQNTTDLVVLQFLPVCGQEMIIVFFFILTQKIPDDL